MSSLDTQSIPSILGRFNANVAADSGVSLSTGGAAGNSTASTASSPPPPNRIAGTNGNDRLVGLSGDNIFEPQLGVDQVNGGAGIDTLVVDYSLQTGTVQGGGASGALTRLKPDGTVGDRVDYTSIDRFNITGTAQADRIYGWTGSDRLVGGAGNDLLNGNLGSDIILGGEGNDIVISQINVSPISSASSIAQLAAANVVILDGGAGIDTLSIDLSSKTADILLDTRSSQLLQLADGTTIQNFEVLADVYTGSGNDTIVQLDRVDNVIHAGAGNDRVNPGASVTIDRVDGGAGSDTLVLNYASEITSRLSVNENIYMLEDTVQPTSSVQATNFEAVHITGTPNDDVIVGTIGDDILAGGSGNDTLSGLGGNDVIEAGDGDDTVIAANQSPVLGLQPDDVLILNGGTGIDTLSVNLSQKQGRISFDSTNPQVLQLADGTRISNFERFQNILTGSGSDRLVQTGRVDNQWSTGAGDDFVNPGLGRDTVDGGAGIDTLYLDYSSLNGTIERLPNRYQVTEATGQLTQVNYSNFERFILIGTANSDTLIGDANDDDLQGGAGNDRLRGEAGDDALSGGLGNDLIEGGAGIDRLIETGDVNFVATNTTLTGLGTDQITSVEELVLTGGRSNNAIDAAAFTLGSVTLSGLGGNDSLIGSIRDDSLSGGIGDDIIRGGAGSDTLIETANVDFRLTNQSLSGVGLDTLAGIEQATLTGGASANTLDASTFSGGVTLVGGAGNDTLIGATNSIGPSISQYASSVIAFSSQFGSTTWSAAQALGTPDVFRYSDSRQAWAPAFQNGTIEFLTVGFATPAQATGATIRQNLGNGFVRKIEVLQADNTYTEVWQGIDPSLSGEVVDFRVNWAPTSSLVTGLRLTIDTNHNPRSWEEIDSVQLHGLMANSGDRLEGGLGNDTLIGGAGDDLLVGGAGSDRFVYSSMGDGHDTITDFRATSDVLDLQALIDNLGYSGSTPIADGYLQLVQQGANTQIQIDADGQGSAVDFTTLVTLNNVSMNTLVRGSNLRV